MVDFNILLDSGAFTAFVKHKEITIDSYIAFVKENSHFFWQYFNLDVIGDAEASIKNQRIMEKAGLSPIPVFHVGEPFSYLEMYAKENELISLGCVVLKKNVNRLVKWIDDCFGVVDKIGNKNKIHGLGIGNVKLIYKYPWYSVDNSSWITGSQYGSVLIPVLGRDGKPDFERSQRVIFSQESVDNRTDSFLKNAHFNSYSDLERMQMESVLSKFGFSIEELKTSHHSRLYYNIEYYSRIGAERNVKVFFVVFPFYFKEIAVIGKPVLISYYYIEFVKGNKDTFFRLTSEIQETPYKKRRKRK